MKTIALISILALAVSLVAAPPFTLAPQTPPDWWDAQRQLNDRLSKEPVSLAQLARTVTATPPTNAHAAMFKFAVLVRAGMHQPAVGALRELKTLCPQLPGHQVTSIYYECGDNLHAWDLAKAALETFPTNFTEVDIQNRLLKHLLDSGWSIDQADAWLASMPAGRDSFWRKARLYFNRAHGRGDALEQTWAQQVRQNPTAIQPALEFLDALTYARDGRQQPNLFWMTEVLKPTRATEASDLAARLQNLQDCPAAIAFYRKAIAIPLTQDEINQMSMMRQMMAPGDTLRASFEAQVREGLAQCLLATGDAAEAQKWMVQAQDIREKHHLSRNASLAGQVQARSNQRTIEARIQAEEKASEDDPNYWTERAQYYAGRNEPAQQEDALKRALALTVPKPTPERQFKGYVDWRGSCLQQYANFLLTQKRAAEGANLLLNEIKTAPAEANSSSTAVRLLCFEFKSFLRVDDETLWTWLRNRPRWEFPEDRLLWDMLQAAKPAELDQYFTRAENLARGQDPTRLHSLGWVMNRMHFPERSIPLLKDAVARAPDQERQEKFAFTLFESYLDAGDWKNAEAMLDIANRRLTFTERPQWSGRLALIAAQKGAPQDALRIWTRLAEINPAYTEKLKDLAPLGLRADLIAFYRDMQKKMPGSAIPARALALLDAAD